MTDYDSRWEEAMSNHLDDGTGQGIEDPNYIKYMEDLEKEEEIRRERAGKEAPHRWGDKFLWREEYFCVPCWYKGYGDGAHPYSTPPCDPIRRAEHPAFPY